MNEPDTVTSGDLAEDESAKVVTRGYIKMLIGIALLAGGLVALCFPVYLDAYDQWGMQVKCGNGYHAELLQATIDDNAGVDPQSAPTRASPIVGSATHYVHRCKSALVHRLAWVVPVAGLGAPILIFELVGWARGGSTTPASTGASSASRSDTATLSAALLDRRYSPRRMRSSNTTL